MSNGLHLIRLRVDAQRLFRFVKASNVRMRDFDEGYAIHALLAALFDHGANEAERVAPKPFRIVEPDQRNVEVLAYSSLDHMSLAARAKSFADPRAWGVVDLDELSSRPVPLFQKGTYLGFGVRACPVRRVAQRGNQRKERAEVDAFLAKVWEIGDPDQKIVREDVYLGWLKEEVEKTGAVRLVHASLKSFVLGRQHRRGAASPIHHPEAVYDGELEVLDTEAFSNRLARGLGRHRSFGFGMLLLRPPAPTT